VVLAGTRSFGAPAAAREGRNRPLRAAEAGRVRSAFALRGTGGIFPIRAGCTRAGGNPAPESGQSHEADDTPGHAKRYDTDCLRADVDQRHKVLRQYFRPRGYQA
jgi:hypothetical protein